MGCDIHSVAQIKKDNPLYKLRYGGWFTVYQDVTGDPRNYQLFRILAGVRGEDFRQIDTPRGLPKGFQIVEDAHPIPVNTRSGDNYSWVKDKSIRDRYIKDSLGNNQVWMGDHSHSWFLLSELKKAFGEMAKIEKGSEGELALWNKTYAKGNEPKRDCDLGYAGLRDIITQLEELGTKYQVMDNEVRYVFGFDS